MTEPPASPPPPSRAFFGLPSPDTAARPRPVSDTPDGEAAPESPETLETLETVPVAQPVPVAAPALGTAASRLHRGAGRPAPESGPPLVLDELLLHVLDTGGSDLHLTVAAPPTVRTRGEMVAIEGYGVMRPQQLRDTLYGIMTERQRKVFEEELELDFAYSVPGHSRFRVNVFQQRGSVGAVMRLIPWEITALEDLGLPDVVESFAYLKRGLVLVTGPAGSGKSTTLAAIIDKVNRTRRGHIMTIEDPIEFLHQHRGCLVNQREMGQDTHGYRAALRHVLRQDPDVVLIGELRDLDTISVALTAAETGHLVFATLHTQSAQDTITRMVDVFAAEQQAQVRTQLASTLQGVICQSLVKTVDGAGQVAAVEVMVCTPAIRAMIRGDKLQQVQGALQAGAKDGMQTLNADLARLVTEGRITFDAGLACCSNRADFTTLVGTTTEQPAKRGWR